VEALLAEHRAAANLKLRDRVRVMLHAEAWTKAEAALTTHSQEGDKDVSWCYSGEEPHEYEPEPQGPMECAECGAPEEELSIYNSFSGLGWCSKECREASKRRTEKRLAAIDARIAERKAEENP
jgi:hypothetical protein